MLICSRTSAFNKFKCRLVCKNFSYPSPALMPVLLESLTLVYKSHHKFTFICSWCFIYNVYSVSGSQNTVPLKSSYLHPWILGLCRLTWERGL